MKMNRREFLRTSAMAAAAAAVAGTTTSALALAGPDNGVKWDKAPCRFCGTGCHVMVGTRDNRVVAIKAPREAEVNRGLLCVKGYHVGLALYGKGRLTTPLLKKDGKQVPISWDEALDIVRDRILKDPKRFAIYGSGQWTVPEGYAAQKFIKGGLSNNHIDPNARLCMASAVTGYLATYGVDEPNGCYDDLDKCDALIMWGNNPAEMHPILFSRAVDRRARGDKILMIDIGTRRTRTTEQCQHYLEFRPHTDLAIANGIMHLLVKNGTYSKEFVEKHLAFRKDTKPFSLFGQAATWDEIVKGLEPYAPEEVERLSGVPAKDIRMLGELFGDPKRRITSLWCMGMNQHTRGTAINTLVHGVHLLSGHFGKPGDNPTSLTGQPSACGTVREVGTLAHALPGGRIVKKEAHRKQCEGFWNLPEGRINPKPGLHTVAMWSNFSSKDGAVDTIWVQVTNPGQSLPNTHKLFDPSRKIPGKFMVVSDSYETVTTRAADLVLPSAMWVEKNGVFGNSERRTQQWFRQVTPPGDARDDVWQTIAVARRLYDAGHEGMKDKDGRFIFDVKDDKGRSVPVWRWEQYYDVNVDKHLMEEYRPFTRMKHKDIAPYDEYVKAFGLRWPVVQQKDGSWRETRWRFSEFDDPYVKKGAGIQFYHSVTKNDRAQLWSRPYEEPPESPDKEYPFWLCTGRVLEHWHTGSMTMAIPQLKSSMPEAYVELNPQDAEAIGVKSGGKVRVETRRGKLELTAWIAGRGAPPPGSLFIPFFDENLLANELTLDAHCPISKQPDYKKCAARVARV
jgi:nitrate reductase (cytochrome)